MDVIERCGDLMTANELRNRAHRLVEENAPRRRMNQSDVILTQIHLGQLGACIAQLAKRFTKTRLDVGIDHVEKLPRRVSQAHTFQVANGVERFPAALARHDVIHQRNVFDLASEHTSGIERMGNGGHATAGPSPRRRLETHDAAEGRGDAD